MKRKRRTVALLLGLMLAAGTGTATHSQAAQRHSARTRQTRRLRSCAPRPVVRPRVAARQAQPPRSCEENLRRLGAAIRLYLRDHEGHLPPGDGWVEALAPYIKAKDAWCCPQHSPRAYSYALNRRMAGQRVGDEKLWGHVLLFESSTARRNAADEGESLCAPGRHKGGNYFLFVDGRVELRDSRPSF